MFSASHPTSAEIKQSELSLELNPLPFWTQARSAIVFLTDSFQRGVYESV